MSIVGIQEATSTLDCAAPLCTDTALKGSRFCRRHAPISELRAAADEPDYPPSNLPVIPPEPARDLKMEIVAALKAWAAEHDGNAPTIAQWREDAPEGLSFNVVQYRFKSWGKALAAAGLEQRASGRRRPAADVPEPARIPKPTPPPAPTAEPVLRSWFLDAREPVSIADLKFDPDELEAEAAFLHERANALAGIATSIRSLAERAA